MVVYKQVAPRTGSFFLALLFSGIFYRIIMKRISIVFLFFFCCMSISDKALSQQVYPLYNGAIPNSRPHNVQETREEKDGILRIGKITEPTVEVYLPEKGKESGTGVIIFPGGGYTINAYRHEGTDVAKVFQEAGIAAFIVKYRVPDSATMVNPAIGPAQDAQRAIQWVREKAAEMGVKPNRVGVMGFSAGGHLASTAGTHFEKAYIENSGNINLRPDFMILLYPVVSMAAPYVHKGSLTKLLGSKPSNELKEAFSAEKNVTKNTPVTFLLHTTEDKTVSSLNSIHLYEALLQNEVPAELHIYQKGKHGFGLKLPNKNEQWMERCLHWMQSNGWLK
jgi:acetyl esterase/lipase